MIDELANRNPAGQVLHGAKVIPVIVRRDEVIDLAQPGVAHRSHDAVAIPRGGRTAVASVDEQRLTGRGHEERGVSALDVDEIDRQRPLRLGRDDRDERHDDSDRQHSAHDGSSNDCPHPDHEGYTR